MRHHDFRVIQGAPCPKNLAPYVAIVANDARATINSIYRGQDAERETRGHINSHESRLNAVNGNIRLAAKRSEEQTQSIDSLHDSIRDLVAKAETKEAVDLALQKRLEDAQKSQLGRWSAFWAAAAVIVTLLGVMVALLSAVHAL